MTLLEEEYPGIRRRSELLGHLYVRGFTLELWRLPSDISKYAAGYHLSEYETALQLVSSGLLDRASDLLYKIRNKNGETQIVNDAAGLIEKLIRQK
jgi:HD-like signal output (HDOD) protein